MAAGNGIPSDTGGDAERKTGVRIESNLRGLGIALPEPVGKGESERAAVPGHAGSGRGRACSRAAGSATCARSCGSRAPTAVGAGSRRHSRRRQCSCVAESSRSAHRGRASNISCSMTGWRCAATGLDSGGGGKKLSDYLQAANVRIGTFELAATMVRRARHVAGNYSGWRVDVGGPSATGQILIPEQFSGAQPLRAAMERLVLDKPESARRRRQPKTDGSAQHSEMQVHVGGSEPRHARARGGRSEGEPRAAGHPLRQRDDRSATRRMPKRRANGGHSGRAAALR